MRSMLATRAVKAPSSLSRRSQSQTRSVDTLSRRSQSLVALSLFKLETPPPPSPCAGASPRVRRPPQRRQCHRLSPRWHPALPAPSFHFSGVPSPPPLPSRIVPPPRVVVCVCLHLCPLSRARESGGPRAGERSPRARARTGGRGGAGGDGSAARPRSPVRPRFSPPSPPSPGPRRQASRC